MNIVLGSKTNLKRKEFSCCYQFNEKSMHWEVISNTQVCVCIGGCPAFEYISYSGESQNKLESGTVPFLAPRLLTRSHVTQVQLK